MKQETLEEAEKEFEKLLNGKGLPTKQLLEVAEHYFIVGYEIAKERSYSEEEVKEILNKSCDYIYASSKIGTDKKLMPNLLRGWFEQLKKK